MLILLTAAFLLKHYGTHAVPLPASSPTSAWFEAPIFARDSPSDGCHSRTVLDILWSCLATTFACTWVSVHPNVPFKGEGKWTLLKRRIFLMFFSILAPEFMIMWAFKQWRGAVMIREAVNKAIMEVSTDKEKPVRELWTTTHGHLLQMGGFRLSATARENFLWGGSTDLGKRSECPPEVNGENPLSAYLSHTRATFIQNYIYDEKRKQSIPDPNSLSPERFHHRHETAEGPWTSDYTLDNEPTDHIWEGVLTIGTLKQLLSENLIHLPTISKDEIDDRSKGDALSKGIALLQLTWFIVQIITRAVQGLTITELELTTAALAGLNSVMYVFWWSKPRDVRFPVLIQTKGVEKMTAGRTNDISWIFSDQDFDIRKHLWASMTTWIKALFVIPGFLLKFVEITKTFPHQISTLFSYLKSLLSRTGKPTVDENEDEMLLAVDDDSPCKLESHTKRYALTFIHGAKLSAKSALVSLFFLLYIIDVVLIIPVAKIFKSADDTSLSGAIPSKVGSFNVATEDKIFSMIFYSEDAGVKPLLNTSSIAGALFGAVHCLAWHFSFPSHAEQILWRTASVGIVGSCAATFQAVLFYRQDADADAFWEYVVGVLGAFSVLLCFFAPFIYPVARITLLVLAITSLRSLPSSAFDTVDWIEFVPHI